MILAKLIVLPPLSRSTNGKQVNEVIHMCVPPFWSDIVTK